MIFKKMSCHNCGAKIKYDKSTGMYSCTYCGATYQGISEGKVVENTTKERTHTQSYNKTPISKGLIFKIIFLSTISVIIFVVAAYLLFKILLTIAAN